MAIAKPKSGRNPAQTRRRPPSKWPWALASMALVVAGVGWFYRAPLSGYTGAGAAYSAHVVCSCRYIGERSLEDCKKDRISGMALVSLSEDEDAQSITARYPLMPSQTATYRKGYGCVLQKWDD